MTTQDRTEFVDYLRACTNLQVLGVWEKETTAGRKGYADLAKAEAERRGFRCAA